MRQHVPQCPTVAKLVVRRRLWLEDERADEQSHLVWRPVVGVEVTSELFDEAPGAHMLLPDDVRSVPAAVHVFGMSVHQDHVVAPRCQPPQQPEVVTDHVTWLRAVDQYDVTGGAVAMLRCELSDRLTWFTVVDEETVRKLDRYEVGHFQCVVVSLQTLFSHLHQNISDQKAEQ